MADSDPFDPATMCGATNRTTGLTCRDPKVEGRTRCRIHGGATPRGHRNYSPHGGYATVLTEQDRLAFESSTVGHLDDEIRLYRMRLRNVLKAEREEFELIQEKVEEGLSYEDAIVAVMEPVEHKVDPNGVTRVSKRTDYNKLIESLTARINQLEKTRAEMISAAAGGIDANDIAKKVREAVVAIDAMFKPPSDKDDEK